MATTASAITISRLEYIFRYIFDVIFYLPNLAIEDQQRAEEAANNHIRQNRDLPADQRLANMVCFVTCKLISACFSSFALYVFSDTIQIILKYMTQSSPTHTNYTHTNYEYDHKEVLTVTITLLIVIECFVFSFQISKIPANFESTTHNHSDHPYN